MTDGFNRHTKKYQHHLPYRSEIRERSPSPTHRDRHEMKRFVNRVRFVMQQMKTNYEKG